MVSGSRGDLRVGDRVEVDDTKTATDKAGKEYYWVTYNGKSGYVKTKLLERDIEQGGKTGAEKRPQSSVIKTDEGADAKKRPQSSVTKTDEKADAEKRTESSVTTTDDKVAMLGPLPLSAGPKAGFEMEFSTVFALPENPTGPYSRRLLKSAQQGQRSGLVSFLRSIWDAKSVETTPFKKRTVLFRSPHRTWAATTDTTFPNSSNLEIVGAPLTPDELEGEHAEEDRTCLETVLESLAAINGLLEDLSTLAPGLLDVRKDVRLINYAFKKAEWHLQLTQAKQLPEKTDAPAWWLEGLNYAAWDVLKHVVRVMSTVQSTQPNPKNEFGAALPKTSVATLLGRPAKRDEKREEIWVTEIAKAFGVKLDADVGIQSTEDVKVELVPTGFTWREFFESLLEGVDRIAGWSQIAFGGEEDFGYGMIEDETLPPGWYVEETRELGEQPLETMWQWQYEWGERTREAMGDKTRRRSSSQ